MRTCAIVVSSIIVVSFGLFLAAVVTFSVIEHHATPVSTVQGRAAPIVSTTDVATGTTRKPTMTAEQRSYLAQLAKNGGILRDTATQLAVLMQQAAAKPALIHDPTWAGSVTLILTSWQTIYDGAASTNAPPAGLDAVNGQWIDILGRFNRAASDYASGLDQANGSLIAQANTEVTGADVFLEQLATLIQDFENQHN